jgi:hypothetical protein
LDTTLLSTLLLFWLSASLEFIDDRSSIFAKPND